MPENSINLIRKLKEFCNIFNIYRNNARKYLKSKQKIKGILSEHPGRHQQLSLPNHKNPSKLLYIIDFLSSLRIIFTFGNPLMFFFSSFASKTKSSFPITSERKAACSFDIFSCQDCICLRCISYSALSDRKSSCKKLDLFF